MRYDPWRRPTSRIFEKAGRSRAKLNEMISYIKEKTRYWLSKRKEIGIKSATGPKD